jgi:hypothetical protein
MTENNDWNLTAAALQWETIEVNGVAIPMWVSVLACVIAATLATMLWREHRG